MKRSLLIGILVACSFCSFSQGSRVSEKNTIGWFTGIITPALTKKISLHGEYQWRRVRLVKDWQQSLVRTGITYKWRPEVAFQVGYAWAPTFPYGTTTLAAVPKIFPEHRIYEQVVVTSKIGRSALSNRFRLEQRWIGRFAAMEQEKPTYVYMNRFRYMPRLDITIKGQWYAGIYDEILIGFGKNVGENVFDQNRIGALIGVQATPYLKIEAGYINQTLQLGREIDNKNLFQYNNGLMINTYFNF